MVAPDWNSLGDTPGNLPAAETPLGMNDGVIFPESHFDATRPGLERSMRDAALLRHPLRGEINCCVILIDFPDKPMPAGTKERFNEMLFSTGTFATGSANDYYKEVSNGKISLKGDIFGPYHMPRNISEYAGTNVKHPNGTQSTFPNSQTMAQDAVTKAKDDITFSRYDNDRNTFVDALIIVHAGRGAEQTKVVTDIWSIKWTLPQVFTQNSTNVYAFLTLPEDAKTGVSVHELGHLLFGWPDLYDRTKVTFGIGNWCLMASGEWLGGGDSPCHPSAWCKVNQRWVDLFTETAPRDTTIGPVQTTHDVRRVWKAGQSESREYYLLENRQQIGKDAAIPGPGLLIWHIDDAQADNTDADHRRVDLVQADGRRQLNLPRDDGGNKGDKGDPYPGTSQNDTFNAETVPSSDSFTDLDTEVDLSSIAVHGDDISLSLSVGNFVGWDSDDFMPASVVNATSQLAAVSRKGTNSDLFWIARDGTVKHAFFVQGKGWTTDVLVEAPHAAAGGITAVSRAPDRISVFFVSTSSTLEHMSWKEGEDWKRATIAPVDAVHLSSRPVAISRSPDKMQVFWCRPGEITMAWYQDGAGWNWGGLFHQDQPTNFECTAVARSPFNMDVFARDPKGTILHYHWQEGGSWAFNFVHDTDPIPTNLISVASGMTATSLASNHLALFWMGDDRKVRHANLTVGARWVILEIARNAAIGAITAVSRGSTAMDVFWTQKRGTIVHGLWRPTGGNHGWRVQAIRAADNAGPAKVFASTSRNATNLDVWAVRTDGSVTNAFSDTA